MILTCRKNEIEKLHFDIRQYNCIDWETPAELARRLKEHGLEETEASITAKLNRGTFAATFFIAAMKAIGREQVNLTDV